ncbi:hypothetical protein D3C84_1040590 [compost metagenome]
MRFNNGVHQYATDPKWAEKIANIMEGSGVAFAKSVSSAGSSLSASVTQSVKSLDGWGGKVTSNYGMRKHPISGEYKMHRGVDIAGKNGDKLDANVSGKVLAAGTYGSGSGLIIAQYISNGVITTLKNIKSL